MDCCLAANTCYPTPNVIYHLDMMFITPVVICNPVSCSEIFISLHIPLKQLKKKGNQNTAQ